MRVLVGDSHPLYRQAEMAIVQSRWPQCSIAEAGSICEILSELAKSPKNLSASTFDLVVLDLAMPDRRGLAAILAVRSAAPWARILVHCGNEAYGLGNSLRTLGVRGLVRKSAPPEELISAMEAVLAGKEWYPESDEAQDDGVDEAASPAISALSPRLASLSTAEMRVLGAMSDGSLNKQVAFQLNLSEITVKQHVKAILRKLGVTNRTQAALLMQFNERELIQLI